jgi:hypothetical protein
MSAPSTDPKWLPLETLLRINAVCNAFELALQLGQQPRVEDYLGDASGPERSALRRELTALENDYRAHAGAAIPEGDAGAPLPPRARISLPGGTTSARMLSAWTGPGGCSLRAGGFSWMRPSARSRNARRS